MNLKKKTIRGVWWGAIDNISGSGITFLIGIVLARILSTEDFGIIAILTFFIAISNTFIDSGFSNALVRKQRVKREDYNTVFFFNLALATLCYSLLFFCAPLIAHYFKMPILIPVTRILGLTLIINSISIIPRTIFIKKIDFKTVALISLSASLSSGAIGIIMACQDFGVWALVGQQLSQRIICCILFWIFNKWRPALEFSVRSFREMFGYGSKLLISGILETAYINIYNIIIGKIYSPSILGQYNRSDQFKNIFSENLTGIIQRVTFPVLSEIQNDETKLRESFRKIIKMTMIPTFACMLGLIAISKPLIITLIGEKWTLAAHYLQIICLSGTLYPLHSINLNMLFVKGRSDIFLKLEIMKKAIDTIPIIFGIIYGIEFLLFASVLASIIDYYLNALFSGKLIDYSPWQQIKDIYPFFLISVAVSVGMWLFTLIIPNLYLLLATQIAFGLVATLLIYKILGIDEYHEIKSLIISSIKRN